MEMTDILALVAGTLALVIAVAAWYKSGQMPSLSQIQELAIDLNEVAQVAVAASQQLKESGQIDSNEQAFQRAVDHIESWYNHFAPDIDLDPTLVANAVEGAYYWLRKAQEATKGSAPTPESELVNQWLKQQPPPSLKPSERGGI